MKSNSCPVCAKRRRKNRIAMQKLREKKVVFPPEDGKVRVSTGVRNPGTKKSKVKPERPGTLKKGSGPFLL